MDITASLRRVAEIEDELNSRGINPLEEELKTLKSDIKEYLLQNNLDELFDEISEYEAVIIPRSSDSWDVESFKLAATEAQKRRYVEVQEILNIPAIEKGIKNGDLSRAKLEAFNAVKKTPVSLACYIRKRKPYEPL
jgi:hypothetical protein